MPSKVEVEAELPNAEDASEAVKEALNTDPINAFLDHQKRAFEETMKALEALLPEGFKTHSKAASNEFFQSFKVLVDAGKDSLEKASQEIDKNLRRTAETASEEIKERRASTGRSKVKVQVE
jgi:hypothetical protein